MIKIGLIVTWSVVSDTRYELQVRGPQTGCWAVTQLPQEVMIVLQFPCRENKYSFTRAHTQQHICLKMELQIATSICTFINFKMFQYKKFYNGLQAGKSSLSQNSSE